MTALIASTAFSWVSLVLCLSLVLSLRSCSCLRASMQLRKTFRNKGRIPMPYTMGCLPNTKCTVISISSIVLPYISVNSALTHFHSLFLGLENGEREKKTGIFGMDCSISSAMRRFEWRLLSESGWRASERMPLSKWNICDELARSSVILTHLQIAQPVNYVLRSELCSLVRMNWLGVDGDSKIPNWNFPEIKSTINMLPSET